MTVFDRPVRKKKKGQHASAEHAQRERELSANWEKVQAKHANTKPPIAVKKAQPSKLSQHRAQITARLRRDEQPVSRPLYEPADGVQFPVMPATPRYDGELAERERIAKEETAALKNRVAPLGNKMGAQYMNDTDLADFKKGLLRRRS